jgi:hypothetical protein
LFVEQSCFLPETNIIQWWWDDTMRWLRDLFMTSIPSSCDGLSSFSMFLKTKVIQWHDDDDVLFNALFFFSCWCRCSSHSWFGVTRRESFKSTLHMMMMMFSLNASYLVMYLPLDQRKRNVMKLWFTFFVTQRTGETETFLFRNIQRQICVNASCCEEFLLAWHEEAWNMTWGHASWSSHICWFSAISLPCNRKGSKRVVHFT